MDGNEPVFRSLEIIEKRIAEKLTVERIADGVHFSKTHYQRMFRAIVGDSVMEYVTKRKMTLAGRALLETDESILTIALRFGYDSHEGFTRGFRAYMGVSPSAYRKYRLDAIRKSFKERMNMMVSKTTDAIIRDLNETIAETKDVSAYTRRMKKEGDAGNAAFYESFLEFIAGKADALADSLQSSLARVSAIADRPDEITFRFAVIKAIEDVAFETNILALNAGIMITRAGTDEHKIFQPLIDKYYGLARTYNEKARKAAGSFRELAALIFNDMRKAAADKIQAAVDQGRNAAEALAGQPYYAYIRDEMNHIADELAAVPLEDVTFARLDDYAVRLRVVAYAAETDVFRMPSHKEILDGANAFWMRMNEAAEFLQGLSADVFRTVADTADEAVAERVMQKRFADVAFQGKLLLFILRGEIQKMGPTDAILKDEQREALDNVCRRLAEANAAAERAKDKDEFRGVTEALDEATRDLIMAADAMGPHGVVVRFLANEFETFASKAKGMV